MGSFPMSARRPLRRLGGGIRAQLDSRAGLAAARRLGRTGGRPPKLTDDDIEAAKGDADLPDIGVTQIAAPPRRLSGDALSLHPRRAIHEYPGHLI
jgi:hypothetical protein